MSMEKRSHDTGEESSKETSFHERFEQDLREAGSKPVDLDVYFTAHLGAEDIAGLHERIERCDVFVPEVFGWNEEVRECFESVSKGNISPEDALKKVLDIGTDDRFSEFLLEEFGALYKTNKRVLFTDIPDDHNIAEAFENLPQLAKTLDNKSPEEKLVAFDDYLQQEGRLQKEREAWIMSQLKQQIAVLSSDPAFQEHAALKVLMLYGSRHSNLYHVAKSEFADARRSYREMPYAFDYVNEAKRRYMFDKVIDEPLLKKCVVQYIAEAFVLPSLNIDAKTVAADMGGIHRFLIDLLSDTEVDEVLRERKMKDAAKKLSSLLLDKMALLKKQ